MLNTNVAAPLTVMYIITDPDGTKADRSNGIPVGNMDMAPLMYTV